MSDTVPAAPHTAPRERSTLRSVAVPAEHGGWGLTAEPALLGLLVAPSWAGAALGAAAFTAFVARTPLKIGLGDLRRGRRLPRTRVALGVGAVELLLIGALAAVAVATAETPFWLPLVVAAPLLGVELAYDIRSRGRRLVPELAGSIGIAGVAAMIVLADGRSTVAAIGVWAVLAARVLTAIPFVRSQILRLHDRVHTGVPLVVWDLTAVAVAAGAAATTPALLAGALAVLAVVVAQRASGLRPPPSAVALGIRQSILGVGVVLATWLGVLIAGGLR